jgi:hypothetical protein
MCLINFELFLFFKIFFNNLDNSTKFWKCKLNLVINKLKAKSK